MPTQLQAQAGGCQGPGEAARRRAGRPGAHRRFHWLLWNIGRPALGDGRARARGSPVHPPVRGAQIDTLRARRGRGNVSARQEGSAKPRRLWRPPARRQLCKWRARGGTHDGGGFSGHGACLLGVRLGGGLVQTWVASQQWAGNAETQTSWARGGGLGPPAAGGQLRGSGRDLLDGTRSVAAARQTRRPRPPSWPWSPRPGAAGRTGGPCRWAPPQTARLPAPPPRTQPHPLLQEATGRSLGTVANILGRLQVGAG